MTLFGKKNYKVEAIINGRTCSHKFRSEAGALKYINNTLCVINADLAEVIEKSNYLTEYYSNDSTRFFVIKMC